MAPSSAAALLTRHQPAFAAYLSSKRHWVSLVQSHLFTRLDKLLFSLITGEVRQVFLAPRLLQPTPLPGLSMWSFYLVSGLLPLASASARLLSAHTRCS